MGGLLGSWTCASSASAGTAPAAWPIPVESDFLISPFKFRDGSSLAHLRIHYRTLGHLRTDSKGNAVNAILILHGTTGAGDNFLNDNFAGVLFGRGQLLDASKYFIILPDSIGHGHSSKPSDGLHMKFPHYDYDDMVEAEYRLVTSGLHVNHLRLVTGVSMGGMHTWVWSETFPDFMDALMPLASLPVQIAGRNRMSRKMIMDAVKNDPTWHGGEYTQEPKQGLTSAAYNLLWMGSAPYYWQQLCPTRDSADAFLDEKVQTILSYTDANDLIYQVDSSRNYDPSDKLVKITKPLFAVNSADDEINPPDLQIMEQKIKEVKNGRYILIPTSDKTRGHGTHSLPALWQQYLEELMRLSAS